VAKHLDDKTKKKIIAEYVDCGNYSAVARKFGISDNAVKKIVKNDKKSSDKCERKKEENTNDMLSYLDNKKTDAQCIISNILNNLKNPELLETASVKEQATVMAILIDKFASPLMNSITTNKDTVIEVKVIKTTAEDADRVNKLEKEIDNGS